MKDYSLATPAQFKGDPKHVFINNTMYVKPQSWDHYYLQGTGHLHFAEANDDFKSMLSLGMRIEYVPPGEDPAFKKIEIEFNKARRRWTIGLRDEGFRYVYCRLPHGHGLMLNTRQWG